MPLTEHGSLALYLVVLSLCDHQVLRRMSMLCFYSPGASHSDRPFIKATSLDEIHAKQPTVK